MEKINILLSVLVIFTGLSVFDIKAAAKHSRMAEDEATDSYKKQRVAKISQEEADKLLLDAIKTKNFEQTKQAIKLGADVDCTDNDEHKSTALIIATNDECLEIAKFLLEKGASVNNENLRKDTALTFACFKNLTKFVDLFLEYKADVNVKNIVGETPLSCATANKNFDIAKLLLEKGAEVNIKVDGFPLLNLASHEGAFNLVELFLKNNAFVDSRDRDGRTPLMEAIGQGHIFIIDLLFKYNADVNIIDHEGQTALIHTALAGLPKVLKMLLDKGANVNVVDCYFDTAYTTAVKKDHSETQTILLSYGANRFAHYIKDSKIIANNHLFDGINKRNVDQIVKALREGADINSQKEFDSALIRAAKKSYFEIVELLLKHGADISIKNRENETIVDYIPKNSVLEKILKEYQDKIIQAALWYTY